MKDRALRAIAECQLIAAMTEEPGRITRRFLTPPTHEVHAHLRARMEVAGHGGALGRGRKSAWALAAGGCSGQTADPRVAH